MMAWGNPDAILTVPRLVRVMKDDAGESDTMLA